MTRTALVVCAWNHLETTTRPCLESVARFTGVPYRVVCVDNGSDDGTAAYLEQTAHRDPRLQWQRLGSNVGWAAGTLLALQSLQPGDTHVCLLNSDVVVTPRWLSRLHGHLRQPPAVTAVIPNEYPELGAGPPAASAGERAAVAPAYAMTPGTRPAAPPPPLDDVLALAARVAVRFEGRSRPSAPSGFCILLARGDLPLAEEYLRDFERYRRGERDWRELWQRCGASCRTALDVYVFHARGGSGGYYRYDRPRAL